MTRRLRSTTSKLSSLAFVAALLLLWQGVCWSGLVPRFLLPSPWDVVTAFVSEFPALMTHTATSLLEAFAGLFLGIVAAFVLAIAMDSVAFLRRAIYPVLLLTQTVPSIAIAPLLVLWMGYGAAPKVALVFLVCFFPITVGLLDGFQGADDDAIRLLKSMGATPLQLFCHIKLPEGLPGFFTGLKTSVAYSIVGAVIAEWLGGNSGLGVYMTRVRKSYAFDKMFAVIFWVSIISLLMMGLTMLLEKKCMPWKTANNDPHKGVPI